jgi:hypothetical protein
MCVIGNQRQTGGAVSHSDQNGVKILLGDRQTVRFESRDVKLDGLADVGDGLSLAAALAQAAR